MSKEVNWKRYCIFAGVIAIICLLFKWQITLGIIVGTIFYFVNSLINSKKFPSLSSTSNTISTMLLIGFSQMVLTILFAGICWYVGELVSFISMVVGFTLPTVYFVLVSIKKK